MLKGQKYPPANVVAPAIEPSQSLYLVPEIPLTLQDHAGHNFEAEMAPVNEAEVEHGHQDGEEAMEEQH